MKFYRYEDIREYYNTVRIRERIFYPIKETPKGYWISSDPRYAERTCPYYANRKRWVSKTSRKRYAYPTKEQAMESFVARKRRQVAILEGQLERAKVAWVEGSRRLQPINQEAKHLTYEAYQTWSMGGVTTVTHGARGARNPSTCSIALPPTRMPT